MTDFYHGTNYHELILHCLDCTCLNVSAVAHYSLLCLQTAKLSIKSAAVSRIKLQYDTVHGIIFRSAQERACLFTTAACWRRSDESRQTGNFPQHLIQCVVLNSCKKSQESFEETFYRAFIWSAVWSGLQSPGSFRFYWLIQKSAAASWTCGSC